MPRARAKAKVGAASAAPTVKIRSVNSKTKSDLNTAYYNFKSALYWALTKGADRKQLAEADYRAYEGYVHGKVVKIESETNLLEKAFGVPNFKKGEREEARTKYYRPVVKVKGKR